MRIVIVLEDTPKGVDMRVTAGHNDVTNHPMQSLAAHVLANFQLHLRGVQKSLGIRITEAGEELKL